MAKIVGDYISQSNASFENTINTENRFVSDSRLTQINRTITQFSYRIYTVNQTVCFVYRNGIYPLTAFGAKQPPLARSRAISPEMAESVKSVTPEPTDVETRKIINMMCDVKPKEESCDLQVSYYSALSYCSKL